MNNLFLHFFQIIFKISKYFQKSIRISYEERHYLQFILIRHFSIIRIKK